MRSIGHTEDIILDQARNVVHQKVGSRFTALFFTAISELVASIPLDYEPKVQAQVIEVCQALFMKASTVLLVQRIGDAIDV